MSATLRGENAIDPASQSGIEVLACSTEVAQVDPAAGTAAVAIAAVFAPAGPFGAGEVDGVRVLVHIRGAEMGSGMSGLFRSQLVSKYGFLGIIRCM